MKLKVIMGLIGLLLMGLYQSWVYSTFWIATDDVTKVNRVVHVSGDLIDLQCFDRRKGGGRVEQKIYVYLGNRPEFYFYNLSGPKFFDDCNEVYSTLNEFSFSHDRSEKFDGPNENNQLFSGKFEGYFLGSMPVKVTINDYEVYAFKDTKPNHNIFALWLSLSPVMAVLGVLLVRWYRNGGIEKLGQEW